MPELINGKLEAVLELNTRIEEALMLAAREARLEHARMGRPVYESRNGVGVWVSPEEVFARYGLDENGKPKA